MDIQALQAAGKQVIQLGYPRHIPALQETFFETYHKLIWSVIYRYGMTDARQPSADDAYQETQKDLHDHFRKGPVIQQSLAGYISKVTINACNRLCKKETKHQHQEMPPAEQVKGSEWSGNQLIPIGVIEEWEELDNQLRHSPRGDICNRIILAQQCLEMYITGQRPSSKQLIPAWQELSHIGEEDLFHLYDRVIRQRKRPARQGWIPLVAEMINLGYADWTHLPILMAIAGGNDVLQVRGILTTLSRFSDSAVHTRISRLYAVLKSPAPDTTTTRKPNRPEKGA
jgi:hypothetical protein